MLKEQQEALNKALEEGDDVRIITIALQVAASLARKNNQEGAIKIRSEVDRIQSEQADEREYRRLRLDIAAKLAVPGCEDAGQAIKMADTLIRANKDFPIPSDARSWLR